MRTHILNKWTPEELSQAIGYEIPAALMQGLLKDLNLPEISRLGDKANAKIAIKRFEKAQNAIQYRAKSIDAMKSKTMADIEKYLKVIHRGQVMKKGNYTGFKSRFFVLQGGEIKYWRNHHAFSSKKASLGTLSCSGMTVQAINSSTNTCSNHPTTGQPGLRWKQVGSEKPEKGSEIKHAKLATALLKKLQALQ